MNVTNLCPECREPLDMAAAHAESGYEEEFNIGCADCGCVALVVAKVLFITFGGQEETVT